MAIVDNYSDRFKLIVSGFSVLGMKSKIKQSLVGRIVTFEVLGLDFEEFIIFGSYPRVALISKIDDRKYYLKGLIQTYIKKDIRDIGKIRNIMKFNNFLRILADQTGNLLNIDEIASSVGIARKTIYDYLTLLEGTYIARRLPPFFRNLRSELTKMPKIYFEDSGVLNYLKYNDIVEKVSGGLFENSIYAELRKNVGSEALRYWRTQSKQEIDFVVDKNSLLAFEVKKIYSGQRTTSLEYFSQRYPDSKSFIITLGKRKKTRQGISVIYPWKIHEKFSEDRGHKKLKR